ncbi:hypothetical protein IWQ60_006975 [Tieghemiomyces parasiticus]|uniref:Radical SAM core domain-containing protein n=1 Tax=Tieghemiomyces parasiticus TaxID=78921 RepID=A0A9W8DQK5_9FUNG|nr:hypothetical protein IWQ60_006975 [Tieghemiomyces parasiticus]
MSLDDLTSLLLREHPHLPTYRIRQLWHNLYVHVSKQWTSKNDGTTKFLLSLPLGVGKQATELEKAMSQPTPPPQQQAKVESVLIPDGDRWTLCVSSQIGCSLTCTFCHTGTQKLLRNLTPGEIVGQVLTAAHHVGDFPVSLPNRKMRNIVFMGQGEPLYNYRAVRTAITTLTSPDGLQFSPARITVSTSGVVPLIPRLATDLGVSLAVSLHATNDALRDQLVPINKAYPMKELLDACETFAKRADRANHRITFEYVMLRGVNDELDMARQLTSLLSHLPAHVNLITFECSEHDRVLEFAEILRGLNVATTVRWPKGRAIFLHFNPLPHGIMNSTYNSAQKQLFFLKQDVRKLESGTDTSVSLQEHIATKLTEFHRTIQKYQGLAQKEFVAQRQQQAKDRIRGFLDEYSQLNQKLERERAKVNARQTQAASHQELMQRRPTDQEPTSEATSIEMNYIGREQQSLQQSEGAIDGFLDSAHAALTNLREQRGWLKNSRRRLLDTANTLGLSRSVIHYIERRTSQDKWLFWGGVVVTLAFIWFLIHFFR